MSRENFCQKQLKSLVRVILGYCKSHVTSNLRSTIVYMQRIKVSGGGGEGGSWLYILEHQSISPSVHQSILEHQSHQNWAIRSCQNWRMDANYETMNTYNKKPRNRLLMKQFSKCAVTKRSMFHEKRKRHPYWGRSWQAGTFGYFVMKHFFLKTATDGASLSSGSSLFNSDKQLG